MKVQIINNSHHPLPNPATSGSAGMDLRANLNAPMVIVPGERMVISTGLKVALPEGYEMRIQPRSGLALKHGIVVLNSPGCIDSDYRGEIGVILINHGGNSIAINDGDRIAQAIISKYETVDWEEVATLDATERGEGGFGHSGTK